MGETAKATGVPFVVVVHYIVTVGYVVGSDGTQVRLLPAVAVARVRLFCRHWACLPSTLFNRHIIVVTSNFALEVGCPMRVGRRGVQMRNKAAVWEPALGGKGCKGRPFLARNIVTADR